MWQRFTNWIQRQPQSFVLGIRRILSTISLVKFLSEFALIIFFTIMPTLFVMGWVLLTTGKKVDSYELYKAGEFLLYAMSFLSSSLVAMTNRQFASNDWRELIKRVLIIPIIMVSFSYTAVFVTKGKVNKELLEIISYSSMAVSFILFFFAQFWVSQGPVDVREERNMEQQNIMDSLS